MTHEAAPPPTRSFARAVVSGRVWLAAGALVGLTGLVGPTTARRIVPGGGAGLHVEHFDGNGELVRSSLASSTEQLVLEPGANHLRARALWDVPTTGVHKLALACSDAGAVVIDGAVVVSCESGGTGDAPRLRELELRAGPHLLEIEGRSDGSPGRVSLHARGPWSRPRHALAGEVREPGGAWTRAAFGAVRAWDEVARASLAVLGVGVLLGLVGTVRSRRPGHESQQSRAGEPL